MEIGDLTTHLIADTSDIEEGFAKTHQMLDSLARQTEATGNETASALSASSEKTSTFLDDIAGKFGTTTEKLVEFGTHAIEALGTVELVKKLQEFAAEAGRDAEAMDHLAQRTGIAVETLENLEPIFTEENISLTTLGTAVKKLSTDLLAAADGGNKTTERIKELIGLDLSSFKTMENALFAIADKFHDMPDGIEKTKVAQDLFGRSGLQLIPVLNQGSEALQKSGEMAEKFGLALGEQQRKNLKAYDDSLDDLGLAWKGLKTQLGEAVAPTLTVLTNFTTEGVAKVTAFAQGVVNSGFNTKMAILGMLADFAGWRADIRDIIMKLDADIKAIFIDGLNRIAEGVKHPLDTIVNGFAAVRNKLTGNSIVPDMVDEIDQEFTRMGDAMAATTLNATQDVTQRFQALSDEVVGHSIVPDMVDGVTSDFERMVDNIEGPTNQIAERVPEKFERMRYATGNSFRGMTTEMSRGLQDFVGTSDRQLADFLNAASFTWGSIRSSFASSVASMIVDGGTFANFMKNVYKTIISAVVNYFIQAAALELLDTARKNAKNAEDLATHTTTEAAKTVATTTGETARTAMVVAANKVQLAAITATIVGIGALGNAALASMEVVVVGVSAILQTIAAAVGSIPLGFTQAIAGSLIVGATLTEVGGTAAIAAGLAALNTALGTATVAATSALATPFAEGGIVTRPTLALIGEHGPEMVTPLGQGGFGGGSQTITIYLDKDVLMRHVSNSFIQSLRLRGLPI